MNSAGPFIIASVRIDEARRAVWRLYALVTAALLAVYILVVAALEVFVLPQNLYGPIARLLDADAAVRADVEIRKSCPTI
jgi:hypothetical protein